MKSFVEYLIESSKTYEFRIKIAGEVSDEQMERIESLLEKFGLESITKPKRTPIQEQPSGFSDSVKNTEVNIIDVETNYPATPQVIGALMQDACSLPESHVVVVNKNHPEEIAKEVADGEPEQKEYTVMLGSDYDKEKLDPTFGDKYNMNFLKDLETRKYEFAAKKAPKVKTTNDLPGGKSSPIGSKK
jgi:hypothetical protein